MSKFENALAKADDAEGHRLLGELDERLNEPLDVGARV